MALASLSEWRHLECINPSDLQIGDPILQTLVETAAETSAGGNISFLFEKCNASVEATGDEEEQCRTDGCIYVLFYVTKG